MRLLLLLLVLCLFVQVLTIQGCQGRDEKDEPNFCLQEMHRQKGTVFFCVEIDSKLCKKNDETKHQLGE